MNTLKFHLKVIYRKLGVSSRAEAAEVARHMTSLPTDDDQLTKERDHDRPESDGRTRADRRPTQRAAGRVHRCRRHGRRRHLLAARRRRRGRRCRGVDLVPPRRHGRRCSRATRSPSSAPGTRRPAACSSTCARASATATSPASSPGCCSVPTRSSPAWSPCRSAATRAARPPTATRTGPRCSPSRVVVVMTALNVVGSQAVARVQTIVVVVVIGILSIFAVSTLANIDPDLLAPSKYPSVADIIASVALTFFAFLGFGVITFTAKDLVDPRRQLPRAMYLALGIATDDLRRGRARRVRHAHRRRGDRVGRHGARRRRRTDARSRRLLDDDRDRALRHVGGDQRRAVPGEGSLRGDDRHAAVPTRDGIGASEDAPPSGWSPRPSPRRCSPCSSISARSLRSAA